MNIDDLLREYVDRPVPPGFEARVLKRARRRVWQWPVLGLAAAALVAGTIWVRPPAAEAPVTMRARVAEVEVPPEGYTIQPAILRRKPRKKRADPKGNGIQALWAFAQSNPEAALQLNEGYEPAPLETVAIRPLEIELLTIEKIGELE